MGSIAHISYFVFFIHGGLHHGVHLGKSRNFYKVKTGFWYSAYNLISPFWSCQNSNFVLIWGQKLMNFRPWKLSKVFIHGQFHSEFFFEKTRFWVLYRKLWKFVMFNKIWFLIKAVWRNFRFFLLSKVINNVLGSRILRHENWDHFSTVLHSH